MSEARAEDRLDRLETDVHEIKTTLAGLVPLIHRIDERLSTELPHLRSEMATKADLAALDGKLSGMIAAKPGRAELWAAIAAMVGAQALIAAVLAVILAWPHPAQGAEAPPHEPRSCQQLHEAMNKCEAGMRSCDQRLVDRLQAQCQRDEKRLPRVRGSGDAGRP